MTTIEQIAGVPSAAELDALANALFPDLTENVYGVSQEEIAEPAVPEVNANELVQGYGSVPFADIPAGYGAAAARHRSGSKRNKCGGARLSRCGCCGGAGRRTCA